MVTKKEKINWQISARNIMMHFAKVNLIFTSEQVREYCVQQYHLNEPHHPNAWGTAIKHALVKSGYVVSIGSEKSQSKKARGRKVVKYRSLICDTGYVKSPEKELGKIKLDFIRGHLDIKMALQQAYSLGAQEKFA